MRLIAYKNNDIFKEVLYIDEKSKARFVNWAQSNNLRFLQTEYTDWPPSDFILDGSNFRLKTSDEKIIDGIDDLPDTQKIIDGNVINKTHVELVESGVEPMPDGKKIENGQLVNENSTEQRRNRQADYIAQLSPEGEMQTSIGDCIDALIDAVKFLYADQSEPLPAKLGNIIAIIDSIKDANPNA